jgi:hypothetical protein
MPPEHLLADPESIGAAGCTRFPQQRASLVTTPLADAAHSGVALSVRYCLSH